MRFGLILKNLDEEYQLAVYQGAVKEAKRQGIRLVCIHGEHFNTMHHFPLFSSKPVLPLDGSLLLSSIISDNSFAGTQGLVGMPSDLPLISIGSSLDGCPSLIVDVRTAMVALMDHLLNVHGYTRFLYLGGPVTNTDNMRRQRIVEESVGRMKKSDSRYSLEVMNGEMFSEHIGAKLMREYLNLHPRKDIDVIIAGSDEHAVGALTCLNRIADPSWRSCPVTGFDDIPLASEAVPALTTVRQPMEEIGGKAVQSLKKLVEGEELPEIQLVPARLVLRGSCGCSYEPAPAESLQVSKDADMQFRTVNYFGQSLVGARREEDIIVAIREYLGVFKVANFHLLVFDEPGVRIPENASLLYSVAGGSAREWKKGERVVSVPDFFDETVVHGGEEENRPYFLFQLCTGDTKMGMILYTAEDSALPHMSNFGIFLANSLRELAIVSREQAYAESLEIKVKERTAALKKEAEQRARVEEEVLRISDLERMRFSMDLHDDICQRLASIHMICKSYADSGPHMKILTKMAAEALQQTRRYAYSSFPIDVHSIGLEGAIRSICTDIDGHDGFECRLSCAEGVAGALNEQQAVNLYRIAREAVHNAIKHSCGTVIEVTLDISGDFLVMEIRDNGNGGIGSGSFASNHSRRPRGLGLKSMQYRAHQINALFSVESKEGEGTRVEVKMPWGTNDNGE